MERKNLIRSAPKVRGRSGLFNRAASHRGIRLAPLLLAPLLLAAVMLAAVAVLAETSNPAQTAYAHDGDDHTHRCTSPPDARCPGYGDPYPGGEVVWSATMNAGFVTIGTDHLQGWDNKGTFARATMTRSEFTFENQSYEVTDLFTFAGTLNLVFDPDTKGDIATQGTREKLVLYLDDVPYYLDSAILATDGKTLNWLNSPTWAADDNVDIRLATAPLPNAYGYRTIWTALMTAEEVTRMVSGITLTITGYRVESSQGAMTNNLIVTGRDETITIGTEDQPRYPWTGYVIDGLFELTNEIDLDFDSNVYPTADEAAGWTLDLGGGVELPFANATNDATSPHRWTFSHDPRLDRRGPGIGLHPQRRGAEPDRPGELQIKKKHLNRW